MSSFDSFDGSSSLDSFSSSSLDSSSDSEFSDSESSQLTHDVFINFRRDDASMAFVSQLDVALSNAGVEPYVDCRLHKGTDLGSKLLEAIEESRISIVVFSKNYTQSSRCLNQLQKIMECHTTHDQVVVPVFYDVDPAVVRHQSGDFGHVLRDTATKLYFRPGGEEKMEHVLLSWKTALTQAANQSGWNAIYYR